MVVQVEEKLLMPEHFCPPERSVYLLQHLKILRGKRKTGPFDFLVSRPPADRSFASECTAPGAVHQPLKYPHNLTQTGPQEVAVLVFPEPVDMKDPRRLAQGPLHSDPVAEIVAHVITAEGQHSHGIATNLT